MNTMLKKGLLGLGAGAVVLGFSAPAQAYSLPADFQVKFNNFEFLNSEPVATYPIGDPAGRDGLPVPGVYQANNMIEDNWAIIKMTSILQAPSTTTWSDGDNNEHLYAIFWGLATTDTSAVDTDGDTVADSFNSWNAAATTFANADGTDSNIALTDLNGDGAGDAGFAVYLHTGADIFDANTYGKADRDISAAALADGIPDFPNVTFNDLNGNGIKDGLEPDLALQAVFNLDVGAGTAISPLFGGSGIQPLTKATGNAANAPLTGNGSAYADLVNNTQTTLARGDYDGSDPLNKYGTSFDSLDTSGVFDPFNDGSALRDMFFTFNLLPNDGSIEPITGDWDLLSKDPVYGKAIPEPGALALFGLGMIGVWGARRKLRT